MRLAGVLRADLAGSPLGRSGSAALHVATIRQLLTFATGWSSAAVPTFEEVQLPRAGFCAACLLVIVASSFSINTLRRFIRLP